MKTVNFLSDIATLSDGQMRLPVGIGETKFTLYGGKAGPGKTWTSVATAAHVVGAYAALGLRVNVALASRDQKQVVARYADAIQGVLVDSGLGQIRGATDKRPACFEFFDPALGRIYLVGFHDVLRLKGWQFAGLGIDELTELEEEEWHEIYWRVRQSTHGIPKPFPHDPIWATSNPDGIGAYWVFEYFVAQTFNTPLGENMKRRFGGDYQYIEATSEDNPDREFMHEYESVLDALPEHLRRARKDSIWDPTEGARFPYSIRMIDPVPVLGHYEHYRGLDWGFASDPCACVWAFFDEAKNCYLYKAARIKGKSLYNAGRELVEKTGSQRIMMTAADPTLWNRNPKDLKRLEKEFHRAGLPLVASTNDHSITNSIIEKYLEPNNGHPDLFFIRGGENVSDVVTSLRTVRWNSSGVGEPDSLVPHNATDLVYALGYLLHKAAPIVQAPSGIDPVMAERVARIQRKRMRQGGSPIIRRTLD